MIEYPSKTSLVAAKQAVEGSFAPRIEPAVLHISFGYKHAPAHHGSGGERNKHRHHNRGGKCNGELAKQTSDDAAHQKERNEDGDQ